MLVDEFKTSISSTGEDGWDDGDWEKKENAHPAFADCQFPHQELARQMFRHVRSYFVTLIFCHIQDSWRTCVNCVNPVFTDGGRSAAAAAVLSDITIVLDEESVVLAGFVNLFVINPQYIILDNLINYSAQCSRFNDKFQNIRPNVADRGTSCALVMPESKVRSAAENIETISLPNVVDCICAPFKIQNSCNQNPCNHNPYGS